MPLVSFELLSEAESTLTVFFGGKDRANGLNLVVKTG